VVVGVAVTAVVLVGPLTEVDVVLLVAPRLVVAAVLRGLVGVEQPAIKSATPTKTVSTQVADRLLHPFDPSPSRPCIDVFRIRETGDQLASWTTEASPTLA
jgi:hypothetical protein